MNFRGFHARLVIYISFCLSIYPGHYVFSNIKECIGLKLSDGFVLHLYKYWHSKINNASRSAGKRTSYQDKRQIGDKR